MRTQPDAIIFGGLMAGFGVVGLFLAAGARDDEMYVFGLSLIGFAVCFVFGLLRRHYDAAEHAAAAVPVKVAKVTVHG